MFYDKTNLIFLIDRMMQNTTERQLNIVEFSIILLNVCSLIVHYVCMILFFQLIV